MLIQKTITLEDGGQLISTHSNRGMMIRQEETGHLYECAEDPIDYPRTYTETDIPIESDEEVDPNILLEILFNGIEPEPTEEVTEDDT